jgi:phage tail sheath gpL-like
VTIQATVIKFGIGTGEIPRGDDAKTTAEKLAGAINQADALKELVTASASGPKVTITAKKAGKDGNSAIQTSNATALKTTAMTGGEDSVVSEAADAVSGDGKQKQLIPFGAAINANYHRKYGFDMSGASKITSTLVSLPGPVEFLDEIKAFYSK